MTSKKRFTVTVATDDDMERQMTAEYLQNAVTALSEHNDIKYVTVHFSEMDESEKRRLLQTLSRVSDKHIDTAIESVTLLSDEETE